MECLVAALKQTYPKDREDKEDHADVDHAVGEKVADYIPSLLCDVFCTTVNFINWNLLTYVTNLEMD